MPWPWPGAVDFFGSFVLAMLFLQLVSADAAARCCAHCSAAHSGLAAREFPGLGLPAVRRSRLAVPDGAPTARGAGAALLDRRAAHVPAPYPPHATRGLPSRARAPPAGP